MAAYAALVSLMNLMEDILSHPQVSISLDKKQVESLGEKLDFLLNFVECNNFHRRCQETEDLERQIVSAAQKVEDVIESHIVDLIHAGSTAHGETSSKSFLSQQESAKEIKNKVEEDVKSHLQNAMEAMDSIKKSIMELESKGEFRDKLPEYPLLVTSTGSLTTTVGFDEESIQLIERLIQPEPDRQIIPIVGMGGTGKITLARVVYEPSHIAQHFDIRMWATISQEYSVENILSQLLFGEKKSTGESVNKLGQQLPKKLWGARETVDRLGQQLHKKLWGRRYLITLDDMWSLETWDEIQLFLPHNGKRERIVITTRLSNMAAHLSSSTFEMSFLDEEKSWGLFCAKAFGEEDCPRELEEIGKNIVRKCKGLALSIVAMGGHLGKSSRVKEYWKSVENDINSVLDSGDDQCLSILWLSYKHLPAHLKPCFLYMGIFEEDREIYASHLIDLLVSEGFLKPTKGKTKEEIAEDYLEDLFHRNLILRSQWDYSGIDEFFKIHDLVRDLILKVGRKEKFFCVVNSTTQTIDREHRVVIHKKIRKLKHDPEIFHALRSSTPLVRSIKCKWDVLSSRFRLLRVPIHDVKVELNGGPFEHVFQQVNLRYLRCALVPHNYIIANETVYLPPSISLLWNLQTLKIWGLHGKIVAPSEIWKMPQLRHLDVSRFCLPGPPHSNGLDLILQNLHTLGEVRNFSLSKDVCRRIPNIKHLRLEYDEASSSYCPHNLVRFHKLESLQCVFSGEPNWYHFARRLTFPISLQKLALIRCPLHWDDLRVIGLLPHLVDLQLFSWDSGPKWEPIEQGFPRLKFLWIDDCRGLVHWNADSSHFPVLEYLRVWDAYRLDEIPSGIGEIPTLRCISLCNCKESATISAVRILVEQEELGNDGLRVEVMFGDKEELGSFREMLQGECLTSTNLRLKYAYEHTASYEHKSL